jgi:tRNA-splicing ligase RtcB
MPEWKGPLRKVGPCKYEIPKDYKPGMRVPGVIYADGTLLDALRLDEAPEQVANVAFLPGIVRASLAMPDIHLGYGFAIGGVAATRVDDGVISPGGVGYDINCGVRILTSKVTTGQARERLEGLVRGLFSAIPSGVGSRGAITVSRSDLTKICERGAAWAVESGYGRPRDLEFCEESGFMRQADVKAVSDKAQKRGLVQVGTLGAGNHFIEVSEIQEVYDEDIASAYGLREGFVAFQIHSGSRGFGHQVCTDYLSVMTSAVGKYGISLPDRQLACAPVRSDEGRRYFAAMCCAANYAWANRQVMTHLARQAISRALSRPEADLGLDLLYDVAHNIAKIEKHPEQPGGSPVEVCVHRKGATRAFGPGHPDVPEAYRRFGQPVLVPGDMGRRSFVMSGTAVAMRESFGSCCHGAGRTMSRASAKKGLRGEDLIEELKARGIFVKAQSTGALVEEAPEAYKDVSLVVDIAEQAGLGRKVARLVPLGVIKG